MDLKCNLMHPYKRGRERFDHTRGRRDMKKEQRDLKMLALVGVMWLQTKECWKLPEAGRNKE